MYSIVLLAAMSVTEEASAHGWTKHYGYGVGYGACYGVGYTGWPYTYGGWGLPYGGYWAGYACGGACGGYHSPAFGHPVPTLTQAPTTFAPVESKSDNRKRDKADSKDDLDKNKKNDSGNEMRKDPENKESNLQTRARLIFELPQGAELYVDGKLIEQAQSKKSFRTPELKPGEQYFYELRVEVSRDGTKFVENKRITLSAGDVIKTDFTTVGKTTGIAVVNPAN